MKNKLLSLNTWFEILVLAFVCVSYGLLTLKGFIGFVAGSDFLWYHLPNGLLAFGVSDFVPSSYTQMIMDAFPPLADYFQGFLVWLTGLPKISCAANSLIFLIVCALIYLLYKKTLSWSLLLTSFLAVPMFVTQMPSGYVDFFGACGVLLVLASTLMIRENPSRRRFSFFCACLGIILAVYSRAQCWPITAFLGLGLSFRLLTEPSPLSLKLNWARIFSVVLVACLLSGWALRNLAKYGNPTYPYKTPFMGEYFPSEIDVGLAMSPRQKPASLGSAGHAEILLHSVFELSRFKAKGFKWSIDQGFDQGIDSPHFRLGGWSLYTVLIILLMIGVGARHSILRKDLWSWVSLGLSLVVMAKIPQGHELRYFMAIPLCALFLIVYRLNFYPQTWQLIFKVLIFISACHVVEQQKIHRIENVDFSQFVGENIRSVWKAFDEAAVKKPICWTNEGDAILLTGPTLSEYPVRNLKKCDGRFVD